jgi:hypothetical protein
MFEETIYLFFVSFLGCKRGEVSGRPSRDLLQQAIREKAGAIEKVHPAASLLSSHGTHRRDQQHADLVSSY